MNIEFAVNTDWERLEDVLRDMTRKRFLSYGWTGAPGNAGDRVLYPASDLRPAPHVGRRRKLYQECRYQVSWAVKDDGETEETLSLPRRGVEYELLDKDADRTGVTAILLEPRLLDPFVLVLLDIAGEYDEAGASIRQQLGLDGPAAGLPAKQVTEAQTKYTDGTQQGGGFKHEWRNRRAWLFRRVKDDNPDLGQEKVADEATALAKEEIRARLTAANPGMNEERLIAETEEQFRENYAHGRSYFTSDDVRNDYREAARLGLGWVWEPANKLR